MTETATQVDIIVGRRIRRRRRQLGLTAQGLGLACGVSPDRVRQYEAARAQISISTLWQVAGALGTSIEYFFTGRSDAPR